MRQRNRNCVVELVPNTNTLADAAHAEQTTRSEPTDGDDQRRLEEAELLVTPALAEQLFLRRRDSIAASRRLPAGVAAGQGCTVNVE